MANIKRGLFRLYIALASVISIITIVITINEVVHLNKTMSTQIGFFQAEVTGIALPVLLFVWSLPVAVYHLVRWIIRGFCSR